MRGPDLAGDGLALDAASAIAGLFPVAVVVSVTDPRAPQPEPFADEAAWVAGAAPKRRREFAAGRACARDALTRLGGPAAAIPRGADRAPVWPPGFVGSISHCEDFCCAVVAPRGRVASLGVDAEHAVPLEAGVARLVCRPEELAAFERLRHAPACGWPKVAFVAKEAFYKAYCHVAHAFLDFQDVALDFLPVTAPGGGRFTGAILNRSRPLHATGGAFVGAWVATGDKVYAGVSLPDP